MAQTTPRAAELMPEVLEVLRKQPMTRQGLIKHMEQYSTAVLHYDRLRLPGLDWGVSWLVRDQRIERTGRGSYRILPKGFEKFTVEDGFRIEWRKGDP
jgi:hypothetical protein